MDLVLLADAFGHFGVTKTVLRLEDQGFWWKGMAEDVTTLVQQCRPCISNNAHREVAYSARSISILSAACDHVHMDLLQLEPSYHADPYNYVFLLVCHLSKYPVAFPVMTKEAEPLAQLLWKTSCQCGIPALIVSDNGAESVNSVVGALTELHGIGHWLISAYHPHANGQVERYNRVLISVLRKVYGATPDRWTDWLDVRWWRFARLSTLQRASAPSA